MSTDTTTRRSYGTGSLYVRADGGGRESWYGKWRDGDVQVKRRIGPKRQQGHSAGAGGMTKRDAEAALRELRRTVRAEHIAERSSAHGRSLQDVTEAYIAARDLKESTTDDYRMVTREHLTPFFGDRPVGSITSVDIEDLIAVLQGKGLRPRTVRSYLTTLSTFLGYAHRKGWMRGAPMDAVDLPPLRRNDEEEPLRFLRVFEVHDLAAAAIAGEHQTLDRVMYLTAALTGLRQGELRGLRWRDVDAAAARLHVVENIVRGRTTSPKSRKIRSVPMASQVAVALEELREESAWTQPEHPVFACPMTGRPVARTPMMERYRKALKAAKLDEAFRFHDLRHTFGTSMAMAGQPVTSIQAWMGHSDLKTTQRYMHYAPALDEAARIDAAFGAAGPRAEVSAPAAA